VARRCHIIEIAGTSLDKPGDDTHLYVLLIQNDRKPLNGDTDPFRPGGAGRQELMTR
jgi:hypothetical protein